MAGAVLCTLNTRHDSSMIAGLLRHSEAKIIFVDHQLLQIAQGALNILHQEYENLLASGSNNFTIRWPKTEMDPISVNHTSSTTSSSKGVVYNHRGAYLNTIDIFLVCGMGPMPTYLWTVPMFHCNGWCVIWGMAALGGTNVCLRHVSAKIIF
ncbi:hypothetical protein R3W88_019819 [Solanum pinnatisectum]|uniref:AMP-dependent synthetase/ligase domain-containing protein n=1 Tax=Solanum pinnatisectum TaxID=50273 RepID=A0AAV9KLC6_9SOLN|nr:hypothetical protein R3W88_019819 [Solanum pinnatisectum]